MKGRWTAALVAILLAAGAVTVIVVRGSDTTRAREIAAADMTDGDPKRGKAAIVRIGCGACHRIPGIATAVGRVGPDLSQIGENVFVAGVTSNKPGNIVQWILNPQAIDPKTAMPDLGLDRQTAKDIAAFLYSASGT
jgi:cytochrome c